MLKAVVAPDDGSSTARRRSSADKEESAYSSEGFTFLGMVHRLYALWCFIFYRSVLYYSSSAVAVTQLWLVAKVVLAQLTLTVPTIAMNRCTCGRSLSMLSE